MVDFRQLNRAITFDSEHVPNPEAIFALCPNTRKVQRHSEKDAVATVSSKLDYIKGYRQIAMHAKYIEKNAFSSLSMDYYYATLPIGAYSNLIFL